MNANKETFDVFTALHHLIGIQLLTFDLGLQIYNPSSHQGAIKVFYHDF